jgi:hypothetical protein
LTYIFPILQKFKSINIKPFPNELIDAEYQVTLFCGDDRIVSPALPELELTANASFSSELKTFKHYSKPLCD